MLTKNTEYTVSITDMNNYGYGVARIDGIAVFVPGCAVGDTAKILIIKTAKSYAVGKLLQIIEPSPQREKDENICHASQRCGGCNYQHINYETELLQKQKDIMFAFKKEGFDNIEVFPVLSAKKVCAYRNKAQFPVGYDKNGKVVCGFYRPKSHDIVDFPHCSLTPEIFGKIAKTVCDFANEYKISAYSEEKHKGILRHIFLRANGDVSEIVLCLVINAKELPCADKLIKVISENYPEVCGIVLNFNREKTNVILGGECKTLYGRDYINDTLCGVKFKISPLSFYQVNHDAAQMLLQKASELLKITNDDVLLDLYCGIGTVGLALGKNAKKLYGIEIVEKAVENAKENASANGFENAEFYCGDAAKAKEIMAGNKITAVSLDPPRHGLDAGLIEYVAKEIAPENVLYISCNPSTLARDCKIFKDFGYTFDTAYPVDLFPRTGHCEVVCLMSKV